MQDQSRRECITGWLHVFTVHILLLAESARERKRVVDQFHIVCSKKEAESECGEK